MEKNIRLTLEYDGTEFAGWQRQRGSRTIQSEIEDIIRRVTGERTVVYGAGRTDSGVHARGQVCNFFTAHAVKAEQWASILNFFLPPKIRISESLEVSQTFHAQRLAQSKVYEYRILNRRFGSALDARVLFYSRPLNWDGIRKALPHFIGEMDFRSFQGAKADVRSTVRQISRFDLDDSLKAEGLYRLEIEGTGFLKQMIRAIVGTLIKVGESKLDFSEIPRIIEARDRRAAGPTAPAVGLCLLRVNYDSEHIV